MENLKHIDVKHLKIPTARVVHDAAPEVPFWGWPTATIDWCEESIISDIFVLFGHLLMIRLYDYTLYC
jgi:hypothetical protein